MTAGLRWSEDQLREHQKRRGNGTQGPQEAPKPERGASGRMNKTETRYAAILEARKRADEIVEYRFGAVTLLLADDTRYTPDFFVEMPDGYIECHEVKGGFIRDRALIKPKVAAAMYPRWIFRLCQRKGGEWTIKTIGRAGGGA